MKSVVAVDVGGTSIKSALMTTNGRVLTRRRSLTPVTDGPDAVVRAVRAAVFDLVVLGGATPLEVPDDGPVEVVAVGLAVPGSVDAGAGVARFSVNLGWRDVPLRALVRQDTGLPTVVDHDVRAAGVAESAVGLTGGVDDSLLVVIGTGIAGVLTVAGSPVSGASGLAGEIGHVPVWPDGEQCPCGQRGCLERYASAAAISRHYAAATGATTGTEVTAEDVARLSAVDPVARGVWAHAVDSLAIGLATCTMTLDPALIVIGGGLSQAGDDLLGPLRSALAQRVRWRSAPRVELSPLGASAGLVGAGILAAHAVSNLCPEEA
jgi:glucokinase